MCNLYSMTATVDEMKKLFGSFDGERANLPPFDEIYPGKMAPVLRRGESGGLKLELREHDDALKALKREARQASSLPDKLAIQRKIKQTEALRDSAWRAYDTEARTIEAAKEALIDDVEQRLTLDQTIDRVLSIRFTIS